MVIVCMVMYNDDFVVLTEKIHRLKSEGRGKNYNKQNSFFYSTLIHSFLSSFIYYSSRKITFEWQYLFLHEIKHK